MEEMCAAQWAPSLDMYHIHKKAHVSFGDLYLAFWESNRRNSMNTLSIEESISIYGGNCKEAYNMGHKLGQKLRTIVDDILLATGIYKIL